MDKELIIRKILKERYSEGKEIAEIVIDYIDKHPDWKKGDDAKTLYKNHVLEALNSAVYELYGHILDYYIIKCRKREFVDVRHMAMYLYHKETGFTLTEVGKVFDRHHSTVAFAYENVEWMKENNRLYAKDLETLKETFKKYL